MREHSTEDQNNKESRTMQVHVVNHHFNLHQKVCWNTSGCSLPQFQSCFTKMNLDPHFILGT